MRILVAEDDAPSRQLLELALRRLGHDPVAFADGEEAWNHLREDWCRVIISDWMMPRADGLELCRRVRGRKDKDYVYFILLTAKTRTQENLASAIDAGVDDFLSKPFERHEVMSRLRVAERILAYTRQIQELERILPICSYCKNIRNDGDYWQRIEDYFNARSGVDFSHSICPDCYEKHVKPQIEELQREMKAGRA
jgi:DNA-binding response OmpR family regulator